MEIKRQTARSILTPTGGFLGNFTHTLNPYGGCAFGQTVSQGQGCPFCYVRQSPVGLFAKAPWGDWVTVKTNAPDLLLREMQKLRRQSKPVRIFMSSSTDPFQGAERQERISERCLRVLVDYPPDYLVVQTRSLLVRGVLPLLRQLGERVLLSMTVETDSEEVRQGFTPTSPPVEARLKVMREARTLGVPVQAAVAPVLPHDPERFADMLVPVSDRVVVDTLFHGDGANGKRSDRLGMRALYEAMGYADWYHRAAHEPLMEALRSRLPQAKVLFSEEGFNQIPASS